MFGVPGLLAAALFSLILFFLAYGFLWMFVLGDSTWPDWVSQGLPVVAVGSALVIWYGLMTVAWSAGRKAEEKPELNRRHVVMALCVAFFAVALVLAFQQGLGKLNPPTPEDACAALCRSKGFPIGAMPHRDTNPRECVCRDAQSRDGFTAELPAMAPSR
jgi:hypothetical protein